MLPKGWERTPLVNVAQIRTGVAKGKKGLKDPIEVPYLRVANVQDGHIDLTVIKTIQIERHQLERYSLKKGDVLMTEGGDFDKLGRGDVWQGQIAPCLNQNHVFAVRTNKTQLLPYFLATLSGSNYGKTYFLSCSKRSTNLASINSTQLKEFPVLLPPLLEQKKISNILSTWDKAIEIVEKLIENSRAQKKALMQKLLTGKKRFAEFNVHSGYKKIRYGLIPNDWQYAKISDIANQYTKKNADNESYPVLSCSKHVGFVDSLEYFKKKVYSDNLIGYKLIPKGCFGFPSNHIEEGSIDCQNLYEFGLVSPIYTIFKPKNKLIDNKFLISLLKTEHYRQIFSASTNASVDRRGSLRWKEFCLIKIALPSLEEQQKIASVLTNADKEIELLEQQLSDLKQEKKALMQQLLTGKRRVTVDTISEALC